MMEPTRTVAVVGAGFSGVITAVHLLRMSEPHSLRVVLVNRTGKMARGVAYGTRSPVHLLNVPAGRMSAFSDDPDHFLRYAQSVDPTVTADRFLPRSMYGEYLESVLLETEQATRGRLDRVVGELTSIDTEHAPARLTTANGGAFSADRVILALGNYPPRDPEVPNPAVLNSPCYIRDPWAPNALATMNLSAPFLLVGSGLTMVDVALELSNRGATGPVLAISRHGLVPQTHKPGIAADRTHRPPTIESGPPTARSYLHAIRQRVNELAAKDIGWRTVIDSLRPITADLWQRMPLRERERFLRHVKPYWEVVRHRAASGPATQLEDQRASGWLEVRAGRVVDMEAREDGFLVSHRRRGSEIVEQTRVGTVINCTGPSGDVRSLDDPLMKFLRNRGLIGPDTLGLGIAVAPNGAVLDQAGVASRIIYYLGPLARAGYWERTAVPELRVGARDIAKTVVDSIWPEIDGFGL